MAQALPTNLLQAIRYFSDIDVCTDFVAGLRWPNGPVCPRCESPAHSYISTRRVWKCRDCKKQYSVKLGTIFEDSPIGLDKWLAAIWLIANSKNGISSHELGRAIGLTQKSAWFVLHRIRLAMQTGSFDKADGTVEVDETFIGGKARNMHPHVRARKITGTGGKDKAVVVGTLERNSDGPSQVRGTVLGDRTKRTLHGYVRDNVTEGSAHTCGRVPRGDRTKRSGHDPGSHQRGPSAKPQGEGRSAPRYRHVGQRCGDTYIRRQAPRLLHDGGGAGLSPPTPDPNPGFDIRGQGGRFGTMTRSPQDGPNSATSEYDRFKDLASKLVKVPKKELDEARERDRLAKG